LGAALGAAAATAVGAFAKPAVTRAADGDVVRVGAAYYLDEDTGTTIAKLSVDTGTGLTVVSAHGKGLEGHATNQAAEVTYGVSGISDSQGGIGVQGYAWNATGSGIGVKGVADAAGGTGVYGIATKVTDVENYGVIGLTQSSGGRGVFGWSLSTGGGTGLWGQTNAGSGAGVRGYAWDSGAATGNFGTGVVGTSGSHAFPPPAPRPNTGVMGFSPAGTRVYAGSTTGKALQVDGKAAFSRSGKVSVPAGASSVSVAVPGGLSGSPLCFANLNVARTGVFVSSVVPSASTGKITIRLNKVASTSASTVVAWFVAG
jgi:hypothetical protein